MKNSAYMKKYQQDNKIKLKKYYRKYYVSNRSKKLLQSKAYHNSKHGCIVHIINGINSRCYNPKNSHFKYYGGKGIQNYLTYNCVDYLWERDRADSLKKPSIDRICVEKDYTLDNCQFIEFAENCAKDKRKPVVQMTLDGRIVKTWISMMEAQRIGGFQQANITKCCFGRRKTHKGYTWKYNNT